MGVHFLLAGLIPWWRTRRQCFHLFVLLFVLHSWSQSEKYRWLTNLNSCHVHFHCRRRSVVCKIFCIGHTVVEWTTTCPFPLFAPPPPSTTAQPTNVIKTTASSSLVSLGPAPSVSSVESAARRIKKTASHPQTVIPSSILNFESWPGCERPQSFMD